MQCNICGEEIIKDSQYINGKYYHNVCIENLSKENKQLKDNWSNLKEWLKSNDIHFADAIPFRETLRQMKILEKSDK